MFTFLKAKEDSNSSSRWVKAFCVRNEHLPKKIFLTPQYTVGMLGGKFSVQIFFCGFSHSVKVRAVLCEVFNDRIWWEVKDFIRKHGHSQQWKSFTKFWHSLDSRRGPHFPGKSHSKVSFSIQLSASRSVWLFSPIATQFGSCPEC